MIINKQTPRKRIEMDFGNLFKDELSLVVIKRKDGSVVKPENLLEMVVQDLSAYGADILQMPAHLAILEQMHKYTAISSKYEPSIGSFFTLEVGLSFEAGIIEEVLRAFTYDYAKTEMEPDKSYNSNLLHCINKLELNDFDTLDKYLTYAETLLDTFELAGLSEDRPKPKPIPKKEKEKEEDIDFEKLLIDVLSEGLGLIVVRGLGDDNL